jgi:hypothetical protein
MTNTTTSQAFKELLIELSLNLNDPLEEQEYNAHDMKSSYELGKKEGREEEIETRNKIELEYERNRIDRMYQSAKDEYRDFYAMYSKTINKY